MASVQMFMHSESRIPGALQRVPRERMRLAAYPVRKPVSIPHPDTVSQPAPTQKSDFTGSALSFWQTNPMAFAARKHLEEP